MKRLAASILVTLLSANGYLACSTAPQYEGGGRHLGTLVGATAEDSSVPDSSDASAAKDTFAPDTSSGGG